MMFIDRFQETTSRRSTTKRKVERMELDSDDECKLRIDSHEISVLFL